MTHRIQACPHPGESPNAVSPALAEARVAIVGLGLMGGSLAMALRGPCARLVGVARHPETAALAGQRGMVDEATTDALEAARAADVVVLAVPVRAIIGLIDTIGPTLKPGALLIDLGSTKQEVMAAMDRLPAGVQAVGGHPLCGKETAGLDAADGGLYRDRVFVLCPSTRSSPQAVGRAEELVRAVGARPLVMDAARHDRLVALTSHLPYLLAASLVAASAQHADPALPALAANGFRDTSRLAGSDVAMMRDIVLTNREPVLGVLASAQAWLADMHALIAAGDAGDIEATLRAVQEQWSRLRS